MKSKYLFQSDRLGFRNWTDADLTCLSEMNADAEVMRYFPNTLTKQESAVQLNRYRQHFEDKGYTYFAVELLTTGECIGFIGLMYQDFEAAFTPAVDIGWRLKKEFWGQGYATEGAKRCLAFAKNTMKVNKIIAICTIQNINSEHVMQKIGMTKKEVFVHPKLKGMRGFEWCCLYEVGV